MKIEIVVEVQGGQFSGDRLAIPIELADVIRTGKEKDCFAPWHVDAGHMAHLKLAEVVVSP